MSNNTSTKATETAKPPIIKLRSKLIYAHIWEHTSENGPFYSVSFERRYTDKKGAWHSTQSFKAQDLLQLAELAQLASDEILGLTTPYEE